MEPIRFHFEVTVDDGVAVKLHQLAHGPLPQKLLRAERVKLSVIVGVVALLLLGMSTYFRGAPDAFAIGGTLAFAMWGAWMISMPARTRRIRRQVARMLAAGSPIAGVTLDRDGIELKGDAMTTRFHWEKLCAMDRTSERIFLRFAGGDRVFVLPLRALPSQGLAFLRTVAAERLGHGGAALP